MDDAPTSKQRLLTLLNALQQPAKHLHTATTPFSFLFKTQSHAALDTLLDLEIKAHAAFSADPCLHTLSLTLSSLRTQIENLRNLQGCSPSSLLSRHLTLRKISNLARALDAQIQSYLDRVTVGDLVHALQEPSLGEEQEHVNALVEFRERLSRGFDLGFQDLVLRAKVFTLLESLLFRSSTSLRVKEEAAKTIAALVKFNKNVFVGLVLMGPTVKALIAMGSLGVLAELIRLIRSPLVDEILCAGEIPGILGYLRSGIGVAALECVMELGYIGRREVVEAMLEWGLVESLMELQRCDGHFEGCVSRFAIQVEVGEGLSGEEKREFKLHILTIVKQASLSLAEAASVSADILWGSSP
ncbi:hypothetical protein Fmac_000697 [Flemingia macrophylla]|uniref:Uncharacterized protein n=1 Tax=Flemingia macrophylla TaxID=520843 RepID=A0ABD1NG98_9FABA